jgi:hypothetical protein
VQQVIVQEIRLPLPNSAPITATGENRTGPIPSDSSVRNTTSKASESVTAVLRRAAFSLASLRPSTLIRCKPALDVQDCVIRGLDARIHPSSQESFRSKMDGRVKPGHDTGDYNGAAWLFWHSGQQTTDRAVA